MPPNATSTWVYTVCHRISFLVTKSVEDISFWLSLKVKQTRWTCLIHGRRHRIIPYYPPYKMWYINLQSGLYVLSHQKNLPISGIPSSSLQPSLDISSQQPVWDGRGKSWEYHSCLQDFLQGRGRMGTKQHWEPVEKNRTFQGRQYFYKGFNSVKKVSLVIRGPQKGKTCSLGSNFFLLIEKGKFFTFRVVHF